MFNKSRLKEILTQYKKDFLPNHWKEAKIQMGSHQMFSG